MKRLTNKVRFILTKRKQSLTLSIFAGVLILFYLYIFLSTESIESFLSSRAWRHRADMERSKNKSGFKSPVGPVDDLLSGQENDMGPRGVLDDARIPNDPFGDDDKRKGLENGGWKPGIRALPGLINPFIRKKPKYVFGKFENVPEDGIIDKLGDDPKKGLQFDLAEAPHGLLDAERDRLILEKAKREHQLREERARKIQQMKEDAVEDDGVDRCIEVNKTSVDENVKLPPFVEYGKLGDPGELGMKFTFQRIQLSKDEMAQRKKDFDIHYFDVWASDRIAVKRVLPDERIPECKEKTYTDLPQTSVLVVFYNEAWTTLLRTIHSILDRSPPDLLMELLLLDDFSDMDHLKAPLEAYIKPLDKVRLFRANRRLGLIRARTEIFKHALAETVIFLDSHVECFPGWMEPLLAPIRANPKTVTYPVIEFINPSTFGVGMSKKPTAVGGLQLHSLTFNWLYTRTGNSSSMASNVQSPTMPGGLYAISRDWFTKLGMYDPGLDVWGGENIEISFKAWMCGGSILLVSCSHVGHVFRRVNPALHGMVLGYKNAVRVAEVWMDHFKHYFYESLAYNIPPYGDVSSRKEIKKNLQCRNFAWYLIYVFPELRKTMDLASIYSGKIRNYAKNQCIDRQNEGLVDLKSCREQSIFQQWQLTSDGKLVGGERLIGIRTAYNNQPQVLKVLRTDRSAKNPDIYWSYDEEKRLVHRTTGKCLEAKTVSEGAVLEECSRNDAQKWKIDKREERQQIFKEMGVQIDWSE